MIEFESSEYTVVEDESSVTICLRTSHGNDEPVIVTIREQHITTSGEYK